RALANQKPARLVWGRGGVGFAGNRRQLKDGTRVGFGGNPDGPADHRLPTLPAFDPADRLLGLLTPYACHCTTTGGKDNHIHGDWAGFGARALEAEHDGAVALVSIGCGADQNPNPRGTLELAKQHGQALAAAVERLLDRGELRPLEGPPHA